MPRNIDSSILAQLALTGISGLFYGVRITLNGSVLYWAERQINIPSTGPQFQPKIIALDTLDFTPSNQPASVTITVENTAGDVTALDLAESFAGAKLEILEYYPVVDDYWVRWVGYCDELTSMQGTRVTITAYSDAPSARIELPKRQITLQCNWQFGLFATWNSARDFDGAECPYQRTSTIGFVGALVGNITAIATTFNIFIGSSNVAAGMVYIISDRINISGEQMNITAVQPINNSTFQQQITVTRGVNGTTAAPQTDNSTVLFANCQFSNTACLRRGMYANNASDQFTYGSVQINRNYFGGFPMMLAWQYGRFLTKAGSRPKYQLVEFGGQASTYGHALPLPYGRCRIADAAMVMAKPEGAYLVTLWAVADGLLATNPTDDVQIDSTRPGQLPGGLRNLDAYARDDYPDYVMQVNGARRHDPTHDANGAPFSIEVYNGQQDQHEPGGPPNLPFTNNVFFPTVTDFTTNHVGFWGTAWLVIRITTQNNPSVDINGGSVNGLFQLRFGRVVRVYTNTSPLTFTRKPTTDPAWVLLDLITSKRAGVGYDFARINIQSFIDLSTRNSQLITSTVPNADGVTYPQIPRWTFNGVIDQKKSYQQWLNLVCLSMYCLPPFVDANGCFKTKVLGPQGNFSSVPVFSSNDGASRNIIWAPGASGVEESTLIKYHEPLQNVPNQIIVNYVAQDPAALNNPNFVTRDAALLDPTQIDTVVPDFVKTQVIIADNDAQRQVGLAIGDDSIRVVSKTVDLPGVTTLDEAVRIGTLILRAGEFAQGGLANNTKIQFQTFYDPESSNLELGDVIQVIDDLLDPVNEQYFRVTRITDNPVTLDAGEGLLYIRNIWATLHADSIYDDTGYIVTKIGAQVPIQSYDMWAPPVTGFTVVENGIYDANNKPVTELTFTYTLPTPLQNFKDLVIMRSTDDGSGNPVGDWRFVCILTDSPTTIQYEITGNIEHFAALSRNLSGVMASASTVDGNGNPAYPQQAILVDGVTNTLPAPGSPSIFIGSNLVSLSWLPYTGDDLKLFKTFHVYRNTVNTFGTATMIATVDGTLFVDTSVASSTTYFYWIVGFSILHQEGTPTASLTTTSASNAGSDTTVPDAPIVGTILNLGSYNTNEYSWVITIDKGTNNQNSVDTTTLQISTDPSFASFPTNQSMNRTYAGPPTKDIPFTVNQPGVYYIRAKVHNVFGDSAWSGTVTRNTNFFDGLSDDTGIPAAVTPSLYTQSTKASLAGNQFEVDWTIPSTNTASYYGYSIYINSSSTLPTATTVYSSFAHAGVSVSLTPGSNVIQVVGSPGFTTNQWAGKDIVVFASSRAASPSFDYEGQMFTLNCSSSTADSGGVATITLNIDAQRMIWNLTGLGLYIVTPGGNNHFFEKLTYSTPLEINQGVLALTQNRGSAARSAVFNSSVPTVYVWVALYNLYGQGPVTASPPTATFPGIGTPELGAAAVTLAKMANNSVGSSQIVTGAVISTKLTASAQSFISSLTFSAASYQQVNWTSGTVKTADGTSYAISSGNTGAMSALTYIYLDPSISSTVLQVTTSLSPSDTAILMCVAENIADTTQFAFFIPAIGVLGLNGSVIQANSIQTNALGANVVTAAKINVADLFSIAITATGSITGATIQTAASGARIVIDSTNGFQTYNGGGILETQIPISGSGLALIATSIIYGIRSDVIALQSNLSGTGTNLNASSAANWTMQTSGVTRFELDSSGTPTAFFGNITGGLSVCDSTPVNPPANTQFYVQSDIQGNSTFSLCESNTGATQILQRKGRGTHASPADVIAGDALATWGYNAYSGGWIGGTYVLMKVGSASFTSGQRPPTEIHWRTNGANGGMTDSIVMGQNQAVQMPAYGAGTATFDASGNITSVSDERLKDIDGLFAGGLDEVLALNPIRFHWNSDSGYDQAGNHVGFIAQDVQRLIPEAVGISRDGYLSLDDRGLIAALVNAVKALNQKIKELSGQ